MSDRLIALALLVGCGFLYWQTYSVKKPPFAAFESFDAVTFPRAVLIVLALFALVLLVRGAGTLVPRHPTRDELRFCAVEVRCVQLEEPYCVNYGRYHALTCGNATSAGQRRCRCTACAPDGNRTS